MQEIDFHWAVELLKFVGKTAVGEAIKKLIDKYL